MNKIIFASCVTSLVWQINEYEKIYGIAPQKRIGKKGDRWTATLKYGVSPYGEEAENNFSTGRRSGKVDSEVSKAEASRSK